MISGCIIRFECIAKNQSECKYYTKCDYDDCNECIDYNMGYCTNKKACFENINIIKDLNSFIPSVIDELLMRLSNNPIHNVKQK